MLVALATFVLQVAWISVVPAFRGSDEFDHALRAAAVAQGQWTTDQVPQDGRGLLVEVPADIARAVHDQCDYQQYTGRDNCNPVKTLPNGNVLIASAAANYNPLYYWLVGTAAQPFSGTGALYAMRVASSLLCLILIGLGAWAVALGGRQWIRGAFVVALSPVLVYSTVVTAPNGLEMAAGLSLWSALLAMGAAGCRTHGRALVGLALVSLAVLLPLRGLGPHFAALIVITALVANGASIRSTMLRHWRSSLAGLTLTLASAAGAIWWQFVPKTSGSVAALEGKPSWTFGDFVVWQLQSIAAFPYRNSSGHPLVYVVVGVAVGFLLVAGLRSCRGGLRIALAGSFVATVAMPVVATIATMEELGVIWQGRYGLPYGVGFIMLSGLALERSSEPRQIAWRLLPGWLVLMAASITLCWHKVIVSEKLNWASVADPDWHPPAWWISAVVAAVGCAMYGLALVRSDHESPGTALAHSGSVEAEGKRGVEVMP